MDLELVIIVSLITALLGFFCCSGYYFAFKKYEKNDEDEFSPIEFAIASGDLFILDAILFVFNVILWISEKIFPKKMHIAVFRTIAFLTGTIFLLIICFLWLLALYRGGMLK
jgi:type IV secretory pathway TrbL component